MPANVDWTPQRLAYSAVLMAWSETPQLVERFDAVCSVLQATHAHWQLGSSYSGWTKALAREHERLLPLVVERLRRRMDEQRAPRSTGRWRGIAVDGTHVTCPRTEENQAGLGQISKHEGMPQLALTVLFDLELGLPWAFRVGPGTESERAHVLAMLPELPENSLLVADAGFIGYDFCRELNDRGQAFLLRVAGNCRLLEQLDPERPELVFLWPDEQQRRGEGPLALRLIVVQDQDRQPVYLVTNVLDPQQLSDAEAAVFYRQRWGEEVFYRTTKQTFEFHTLHSRTPENCYQEMTWAVIGIWLLGLMSLKSLQAAGHAAPTWSPATSRNVVRRVLRGDRPQRGARTTLPQALGTCRKDTYVRRRPKASRSYPRKRTRKPPGPPKIKPATAEQRQRAQQLPVIQLAA